jgi:NADH:ubiquinone oxidoreductase subunit 2 (subunit N)
VDADMIGWAIAGILMSVVALGYYLRLIVAMYMQESAGVETNLESRPWANAMAVACAAGVVVLGVLPDLLLERLG